MRSWRKYGVAQPASNAVAYGERKQTLPRSRRRIGPHPNEAIESLKNARDAQEAFCRRHRPHLSAGSLAATPVAYEEPVDTQSLTTIKSEFGKLMELANRHDFEALHGIVLASIPRGRAKSISAMAISRRRILSPRASRMRPAPTGGATGRCPCELFCNGAITDAWQSRSEARACRRDHARHGVAGRPGLQDCEEPSCLRGQRIVHP